MYRFLYPVDDAYIYEVDTNNEKNFGGDTSLILKKDFDGESLNGVSRILLKFDLTDVSKSLSSGGITSPSYYLRLYQRKSSELSPSYQLNAYALSQSWDEGTGYTTQDPNSRDGVSWKRGDESFDNTTWKVGGLDSVEISFDSASKGLDSLHLHLDTGSRSPGGGIWYDEGGLFANIAGVASQSFSYQSADVEMNVTDIVNKWLDGTRKNKGLILKWSGSQESSNNKSGNIDFYSVDAQSIYAPKLEVRWDDQTGSVPGGATTITNDGTKDNYLYLINLRDTYKETETPKIRVSGRERYQTKSFSTTKSTFSYTFLPNNKCWYSIIDIESGETLIPFGDYSKLSQDSTSSYFKLHLKSLITNRLYKVILRLELNDGRYRIFDEGFDFKVIN